MTFAIAVQEDGSYVLRFEQDSIRCDVAIAARDLRALIMELQMAERTES